MITAGVASVVVAILYNHWCSVVSQLCLNADRQLWPLLSTQLAVRCQLSFCTQGYHGINKYRWDAPCRKKKQWQPKNLEINMTTICNCLVCTSTLL